jgi:hypothetical protein
MRIQAQRYVGIFFAACVMFCCESHATAQTLPNLAPVAQLLWLFDAADDHFTAHQIASRNQRAIRLLGLDFGCSSQNASPDSVAKPSFRYRPTTPARQSFQKQEKILALPSGFESVTDAKKRRGGNP